MTSFTTEDRIMAEKEYSENFSELIVRIQQLSSNVADPVLSLELKQLADRLSTTGNRYHQLTHDDSL